MTDEGALLTAIARQPMDTLPRLVYADWLDDHGRDAAARFLRLQSLMVDLWRDVPRDPVCDSLWGFAAELDPATHDEMHRLCRGLDPAWVLRVDTDYAPPPGLSPAGLAAVDVVLDLLAADRAWWAAGWAPVFRAADEWAAANPDALPRAGGPAVWMSRVVLVVCYGKHAALRPFFDDGLSEVNDFRERERRLRDGGLETTWVGDRWALICHRHDAD